LKKVFQVFSKVNCIALRFNSEQSSTAIESQSNENKLINFYSDPR
jgi:hypothetical protein